jgi:hypothetical protein
MQCDGNIAGQAKPVGKGGERSSEDLLPATAANLSDYRAKIISFL